MEMLTVRDYPLAVDPAAQALEVQVYTDGHAGREPTRGWQQLCRLDISARESPFVITNTTPHLFGSHTTIGQSTFVLGYDRNGRLSDVWLRQPNGVWEKPEIAEEVSGRYPLKPSVRLVFEDQADCELFVSLYQRFRAAASEVVDPPPDLGFAISQLFKRMPLGLRVIPVGCAIHVQA